MATKSAEGMDLSPSVEPLAPGLARPLQGSGLYLSGGCYRAMLFHAGAVWRLNQLGQPSTLARISNVSGGSITAAVLGLKWNRLGFDAAGVALAFEREVVDPIRHLVGQTIDAWYAVCDAAMRAHVLQGESPGTGFPYAEARI